MCSAACSRLQVQDFLGILPVRVVPGANSNEAVLPEPLQVSLGNVELSHDSESEDHRETVLVRGNRNRLSDLNSLLFYNSIFKPVQTLLYF